MIILWEFVTGIGLGLEYFEEEEAYILTLLLVRFIFLPADKEM